MDSQDAHDEVELIRRNSDFNDVMDPPPACPWRWLSIPSMLNTLELHSNEKSEQANMPFNTRGDEVFSRFGKDATAYIANYLWYIPNALCACMYQDSIKYKGLVLYLVVLASSSVNGMVLSCCVESEHSAMSAADTWCLVVAGL